MRWEAPPVSDLALQAEYDAMLLEHAGEAIPALAAAAGGDAFAPFFAGFLPLLLCKTVSALSSGFEPRSACAPCAQFPTWSQSQADSHSSPHQKQGCTVAEKSFAVGTLAESIQGLGAASAQFVSRLLPVLLSTAREADPEVRSNAVFGLGVLAEHGGRPAQEYPRLAGGGPDGVGRVSLGFGMGAVSPCACSLTVDQTLPQAAGAPAAPPGEGAP